MKAIISLIVVCTLISAGSSLTNQELEDAIAKADFVGYGIILRENKFGPEPRIKTTEVLKGETLIMTAQLFDLRMDSNAEYLLLATVKRDDATTFHYPIKRRDQLSDEELTLLNNMPCYSEELEKNPGIDGCVRVISIGLQVCGCNHQDYNNTCEMRLRGILKFKPGNCKDH